MKLVIRGASRASPALQTLPQWGRVSASRRPMTIEVNPLPNGGGNTSVRGIAMANSSPRIPAKHSSI